MPRPPFDVVAAVRPVLVVCLLVGSTLLVSCQSTPSGTVEAVERQAPVRLLTPMESEVLVAAIRHWHTTNREPATRYQLDPYDRRFTPALRRTLAPLFPALAPTPTPAPSPTSAAAAAVATDLLTVSIDRVVLPEGNFAYATLLVGNRYDTREYTSVFEGRDGAWSLRDHFLVAHGLLASVMIEFTWEGYRLARGIASPEAVSPPESNATAP